MKPSYAFRAASFFLVMSYKCWTVCSGKLKHPSGSKTSSSLSDEGGGNLHCTLRSINSHKGLFRCDWSVGLFPAFLYPFTSLYFLYFLFFFSWHGVILALVYWSWFFFFLSEIDRSAPSGKWQPAHPICVKSSFFSLLILRTTAGEVGLCVGSTVLWLTEAMVLMTPQRFFLFHFEDENTEKSKY